MENCEYITRYGTCSNSCERFGIRCPWARLSRGSEEKNVIVEALIVLSSLAIILTAVLI